MKFLTSYTILLVLASSFMFQSTAQAQYIISKSVIANGGARDTKGTLRISGTVGQPAVGKTQNSSTFSLTGFWYLLNPGVVTGAERTPARIPTEFRLAQNYPNPFNPSTTIQFSLPRAGYVALKVYNTLGKEVATLVAENLPAGTHEVNWHANGLPSGVYYYRMETAEGFAATKKLVLMK